MKTIDKNELHEIFQDLRNKKQNAYNKLYEKYYKLVYGIVFSIIKNKEDSEDVTHEIFTKIYRLDTDKLPIDNEASWLFTVSKNECFLFFRKAKPNISIDEIYEMSDETSAIDDIVDKDYFNSLISGLKEDEKLIVSLKVLSNFPFRKISQIMNIPIGTVQWKYYKAINSLKISIGSLAGAMLAFIIVLARGEFWKKGKYKVDHIQSNKKIINEATDTQNESATENINADDATKEQESGTDNQKNATETKEDNQSSVEPENTTQPPEPIENITNDETISITVAEENQKFPANVFGKLDGIQITSIAVGMVLFIISIIFFKKYQQKRKKKSSK